MLNNLARIYKKNTGPILFFGLIFVFVSGFVYNSYSESQELPILINDILKFDKSIQNQVVDLSQFTINNPDFNDANYTQLNQKFEDLNSQLSQEISQTKSMLNSKTQNLATDYEFYLQNIKDSITSTTSELQWQNSLRPKWVIYSQITNPQIQFSTAHKSLEAGKDINMQIQTKAQSMTDLITQKKILEGIKHELERVTKVENVLGSNISNDMLSQTQINEIRDIYSSNLPKLPTLPKIQITDIITSDVGSSRTKLLDSISLYLNNPH